MKQATLAQALAAVVLGCTAATTLGQTYPGKPIRIVVPWPPGGGTDIFARTIGQKVAESIGQQVIVDNRPGATGNIGAQAVAKAPPDGYTLLLATITLATSPSLYKSLGYDPLRDLEPITLIAGVPHLLVVHPSLPAKSVKDLIALAKARPGELLFASAGTGGTPHLCTELLMSMAGIKMTHVPYKGGAPAMIDTVGGHTQLYCTSVTNALPMLKQGRIRTVGVTPMKRSLALPEVPTLDEQGLKGFDVAQWMGILAPAKTPSAIVQRLQQEIARLVNESEYNKFIVQQGGEPAYMAPDEFSALLRSELERWGKLVKAVGVKPE